MYNYMYHYMYNYVEPSVLMKVKKICIDYIKYIF